MSRRARHLVPATLLGALALGTLALAVPACGRPEPATVATPEGSAVEAVVVDVVDGDTVDVQLGGATERVRLLGIDTPETRKPNTPVQCFGPEASARTKALLPAGTRVGVQRDREARDRYGRLLVYLWRGRDQLFVNRSLVADGYARTLSIQPNTAHRADLAAVQAQARSAGRGLWATCPPSG